MQTVSKIMDMKLSRLDRPLKSPFPSSPYMAQLQLESASQILTWAEVVELHETARALCPQRFSWWCSLPPELWVVPQIDYVFPPPTAAELPTVSAMRIDLKPGRQFSGELKTVLTKAQIITLRKICYRVRSDFVLYVRGQQLPTEFDWGISEGFNSLNTDRD